MAEGGGAGWVRRRRLAKGRLGRANARDAVRLPEAAEAERSDPVDLRPLIANAPNAAKDDVKGIVAAVPHEVVGMRAGDEIFAEGSAEEGTTVLLQGWACRYKTLKDGSRQITGFLLPGDFCGNSAVFGTGQFGVKCLTDVRLVRVQPGFGDASPAERALEERALEAIVGERAIMGAWLLNIGQRKAPERTAHLFCELAARMLKLGLQRAPGELELPLTQQDVADALGLTSVHVNRVLQSLRIEGFIDLRRGILSIKNEGALAALAGFDGGYLAT